MIGVSRFISPLKGELKSILRREKEVLNIFRRKIFRKSIMKTLKLLRVFENSPPKADWGVLRCSLVKISAIISFLHFTLGYSFYIRFDLHI